MTESWGSSPLRVTWLSLEWPRDGHHAGGVGRYIRRLAEQVRERVDLSVVAFADAVALDGVRLLALPPPTSRIDRYYTTAWRARRLIENTRSDLVHAHGDDFLLPWKTTTVRSFYGAAWQEAKTSHGVRRVNHMVLAGTEHFSELKASARLGIAPESIETYRCQYVFPPYVEPAYGTRAAAPHSQPRVVFIGSFEGRKRGHLAQEAVSQLRIRFAGLELVVVGPENDAPNWAHWVTHKAGLSDAEVSELLTSAWVLFSPSAYEGFGIPIVEGLAHGLRVVASRNPGSDFLKAEAAPPTPLSVVDDEALFTALSTALAAGPSLSEPERAGAKALARQIAALGSPDRLIDIYRSVLSKDR